MPGRGGRQPDAHPDRHRRLPGGRATCCPGRTGAPRRRSGPHWPGRCRRADVPRGVPATGRRRGPGHLRPDRQREAGPPWRHPHARPARLLLPGAGSVPGRRLGRRAAHRRAGVLRRGELPLLHLAAGCVPTGRGAVEEAERHARLAEEAADSLDYGQEKLYAAMARALVYQAAGDYLGMADALGHWRDDAALDGRSRAYAVLWRPLLIEGLVGSGQTELAAAVLDQLREGHGQVGYLQPGLAWLEGWLAEQRDAPEEARRIYSGGEESASGQSPVYAA